jgi:hypothetical protein
VAFATLFLPTHVLHSYLALRLHRYATTNAIKVGGVQMKPFILLLLTLFAFSSAVSAQAPPRPAGAIETIQQAQSSEPVVPAQTTGTAIKIPDGTRVEIEAPYTLSSMDFKPKDKISFRVVDAVKIDGVTVIEQGATATGIVDKAKRGGHWGKAGTFVWTMQTVTAADGSQVPVRATSVRLRGDSKGAKVATAMIITGALMPLIAPVALLHGFKRGENAYIPAGKRYTLFVEATATGVHDAASAKSVP